MTYTTVDQAKAALAALDPALSGEALRLALMDIVRAVSIDTSPVSAVNANATTLLYSGKIGSVDAYEIAPAPHQML